MDMFQSYWHTNVIKKLITDLAEYTGIVIQMPLHVYDYNKYEQLSI